MKPYAPLGAKAKKVKCGSLSSTYNLHRLPVFRLLALLCCFNEIVKMHSCLNKLILIHKKPTQPISIKSAKIKLVKHRSFAGIYRFMGLCFMIDMNPKDFIRNKFTSLTK